MSILLYSILSLSISCTIPSKSVHGFLLCSVSKYDKRIEWGFGNKSIMRRRMVMMEKKATFSVSKSAYMEWEQESYLEKQLCCGSSRIICLVFYDQKRTKKSIRLALFWFHFWNTCHLWHLYYSVHIHIRCLHILTVIMGRAFTQGLLERILCTWSQLKYFYYILI